jgi:hypothetical protein
LANPILPRKLKGRAKARVKRDLYRRAKARLGKRGTLSTIMTRAAQALGVEWNGSKAVGYRLLEQFIASDIPAMPSLAVPKPPRVFTPDGIDVNSDEFLASYRWRSLRMVVLTKRGPRCECCGASANDGVRIHVDHIKPRRRHPELALDEDNLQVLCEACNHGKGNWDETDWRKTSGNTATRTTD